MLLYFLSCITSATGAFVYPAYASYKTLSRRPASAAEVERWLMYWSVLGTIVGLEYIAEWTVSWLPFYHSLKTLFLLYLALPQTRGASYVYTTHLAPCLARHEAEIDAALGRVKEEAWRWVMLHFRRLLAIARGESTGAPPAVGSAMSAGGAGEAHGRTEYEREREGVTSTGTGQLALALWQTYAPALAGLLRAPSNPPQHPPPPPSPHSHSPPLPPASHAHPQPLSTSRPVTQPSYPYSHVQPQPQSHWDGVLARGTTSALDSQPDAVLLARRRALEAELSALPLPNPYDAAPSFPVPYPQSHAQPHTAASAFPIPTPPSTLSFLHHPSPASGSSTYLPVPASASSTYLPAAPGDERGRYEEIGKDDVESEGEGGEGRPDEERGSARAGASGASWTSWWWGEGSGSRGDGYERVKTE